MADDEVLEKSLELERQVRDRRELRLQHLKFDDHVPEKLAARGVGKRAIVGQFVYLADVVKKRAGKQQIAIHLRIVSTHQVAGTSQRTHVDEQAADIGVMERLGGGSIAVCGCDLLIGHEGLHQSLEMRILEGRDELRQGLPKFVNISGGLG